MFSERSRYKDQPTDRATLRDGRVVSLVRFPARPRPLLIGFHKRHMEQRLDHLANFYLKDPAAFWRICDANGGNSPHALGARELIGIPGKEQ